MKIRNWTKKLRDSFVAAGLCLPAAAGAASLHTELVVNGGFESVDAATAGPFTSVAIDGGWDAVGADPGDGFAYPYSSAYSGSNPPAAAGDWHFTGGFGTTDGETQLSQTIDLSGGETGALIPGGAAKYSVSAFFSSYRGQGEASEVRVRFLDAADAELGAAVVGGTDFVATIPVTDGQVDWGQDAAAGLIPAATTSVAVEVVSNGAAGNWDGYLDLVSFQVVPEPTSGVLLVAAGIGVFAATRR